MTRLLLRTCLAVLLVLSISPAGPAAGSEPTAASRPSGDDKIQPRLDRQLRTDDAVAFWVRFEATADLDTASAIDDWDRRGTAVAAALRRTAEKSQADVRERLDADGVDYRAFWATNAIRVGSGDADLAAELAAEPEVQGLYPTRAYSRPDPIESSAAAGGPVEKSAAAAAAAAVEWGIDNVNADDVWEQYGVTGEDIVIANIDTGVQYDHPALVDQYRGNNGDGTFDHSYNWFDSRGACGGAPCPSGAHGTHTMGTMVGDDGDGNQIGVAPGATWIAANGCCPSDAALIESGQWMLEPTDLNGENPDASKRPDIINNSWGSEIPSTDPFMEDISLAWQASGIFDVWSNGNEGPDCDTATSPGSRTINYSVGAYDSSNTIAYFSSRGTGQDGLVKPNISAPGVAVRSSVPGGQYDLGDGTSMAAPHVAGTVALLWSAAPALVGDVDATRELLDQTAVDAPDDQCGGTDGDNNVYGEGRLDALSLLDAAPVGDTGTLAVSIVESRGGDPIAGARLSISGPVERERVTGPDGSYSLPLPVGEYAVTASAFGYRTRTVEVTVEADQTTSPRIGLEPLPTVRVSGTVTDGSGQGWPLYAAIRVDGRPGGPTYTDPRTGGYRLRLPVDATYTLTIEPQYGGYQTTTREITVGTRNATRRFAVPIDAERCVADGYQRAGLDARFTSGRPNGWSVVDDLGGGAWRFDDPFDEGNLTGGSGGFAVAQNPQSGVVMDTSLVSPAVELDDFEDPVIGFRQHFTSTSSIADVDLSLDGGDTWETVLHQDRSVRGPDQQIVPIPQAAGESDVRVRFHYHNAKSNPWFWEVDDVFVGSVECVPAPGGLVLGHVRDRNTGVYLNGASVTGDGSDAPVRSTATPDDPRLSDGFYAMFSRSGRHRLVGSADADRYRPDGTRVWVGSRSVSRRDFWLAAGRVRVVGDLAAEVRRGRTAKRTLTITNTGTAAATVRLSERAEGIGSSGPTGWQRIADYPIPIMDNAVGEHRGRIYSVGGVDGDIITAAGYAYDPAADSWSPIADLPEGRESAAGAFIGDRFYVSGGWNTDVRASRSTFAYDPATDTWTTLADGPVWAAASGQAVLDDRLYLVGGCTNACGKDDVRRYDPATDSWDVLADYPESTSHLACAGIDGQLYCAGGRARTDNTSQHAYSYDPATDTWTQLADLPIKQWAMGYTAASGRLVVSGGMNEGVITNRGFVYEPELDAWFNLPAASGRATYRGGSACGMYRIGGSDRNGFHPVRTSQRLSGYGDCRPVDVPWLSFRPGSVTLDPGERVRVTVRMGGAGLAPGVHRSGVWIREDTPYENPPADVTLRVRR